MLVRLVADCGLLERELDPPGDKVLDRSREPDVDLDRDRDGTDAEEAGECDLERLLLLLGGVLESDLDLDRLGDRLDFLLRAERGVLLTLEEEVVLLEVEDSPAGVGAVLFPVVGVLGSRSVCDMRSERSSIPPP